MHAGKVLNDSATLESSGIKENDFIVCMVTKEAAKVEIITHFLFALYS